MNRRNFLRQVAGLTLTAAGISRLAFSDNPSPSALKDLLIWAPYDAFLPDEVNPHIDDPSDGTQTGVLKAADILAGQTITMQYWHEHNGIYHMFTVTADNMTSLKNGNPVVINIPTTVVADHYHFAIIDPNRPA